MPLESRHDTTFEAGREFAFVPVASIRKVAHVVKKDPSLSRVHFNMVRLEPSGNVSDCKSVWATK